MCVAPHVNRDEADDRLHPVPFRDLATEARFAKYQEVAVDLVQPKLIVDLSPGRRSAGRSASASDTAPKAHGPTADRSCPSSTRRTCVTSWQRTAAGPDRERPRSPSSGRLPHRNSSSPSETPSNSPSGVAKPKDRRTSSASSTIPPRADLTSRWCPGGSPIATAAAAPTVEVTRRRSWIGRSLRCGDTSATGRTGRS